MNVRHTDEIRNFVRDNALPTYNPAVIWDESTAPFNIDEPIIYCRQEGSAVDGFVRQVYVDIYLFSPKNCSLSALDALFTDAVAALEYVKANPNVGDDIITTITTDVMGEYSTGQNRRYYRFQVLCYSARQPQDNYTGCQ